MGNTINTYQTNPQVQLIEELISLSWEARNDDTAAALGHATEAYDAACKINYTRGIAYSLRNIAVCNQLLSQFNQAISKAFEAQNYFKNLNDKRGESAIYNCLGICYLSLGDFEQALQYHLSALKFRQEINDLSGKSASLLNIGNVYKTISEFDKALVYYYDAYELVSNIGDKLVASKALNNIGGVYVLKGDYAKALETFKNSIALNNEINARRSKANVLINIAELYILLSDWDNAQKSCIEALHIHVEYSDVLGEAYATKCLGNLLLAKRQAQESINYFKRALITFEELKAKAMVYECNKALYEAYLLTEDYKTALHHLTLHYQQKEEAQIQESRNKIENITLLKQIEVMKSESEIERLKNVELKTAYEQIGEKNRNILDSIHYAQHIQEILLPNQESISKHLPDSFIFLKPKDIVSGDFFWCQKKNNKIWIAAVDCTGHGVPGAFMSLAANNMLNNSLQLNNVDTPAQLLFELNNAVFAAFKNENDSSTLKSGMDLSLCCIDMQTLELNYAGVHNSVYIVNGAGLTELKSDKIILGNTLNQQFNNNVVQLKSNDSIYLFTDGYADQKGGTQRRKFFYPPFKELLISLRNTFMQEQEQLLAKCINNWMKNELQVDDMLVIGIRV